MRCPFHHRDAALVAQLTNLTERIEAMTDIIETLTAQGDQLAAQVVANNALLADIKAKLDAAIASRPADNGAALQALSDHLAAISSSLIAADAAAAPAPVTPAPAP